MIEVKTITEQRERSFDNALSNFLNDSWEIIGNIRQINVTENINGFKKNIMTYSATLKKGFID